MAARRRRGGGGRPPWLILYTPLEGLEVCILIHPDPSLRGLRGRVVLETRRCLVVEFGGSRRRCVEKRGALLAFKQGSGGWVLVRGEEILGSLWERLKRLEKGRGVVWLVGSGEERRYTGCEPAGEDL